MKKGDVKNIKDLKEHLSKYKWYYIGISLLISLFFIGWWIWFTITLIVVFSFLSHYQPKLLKKFVKGIFIVAIVLGGLWYFLLYQPAVEEFESSNIQVVKKIVKEYYETHTYSEPDFFVCADMAIDVWNLIKSKGINAKIHAGNVDEDIWNLDYETFEDYLKLLDNVNHAWVVAEIEPFEWVAVETTSGYLVWGERTNKSEGIIKNKLYYQGFKFDNPGEFKKFIELRTSIVEICEEATRLEKIWNEEYVGKKRKTYETGQFEGRVDQKAEECNKVINQMSGLLE